MGEPAGVAEVRNSRRVISGEGSLICLAGMAAVRPLKGRLRDSGKLLLYLKAEFKECKL